MTHRHRDDSVRLRPLRAVAFAVSVTLTLMAAVAAVGVLPDQSVAAASTAGDGRADDALVWPGLDPILVASDRLAALPASMPVDEADSSSDPSADTEPADAIAPHPPGHSGEGRRVVFDLSGQQVWLVGAAGSVRSTYLVSGSVVDNLDPGRYAVYSRSAYATSFDYSATMRWMVRFTEGANAAIGFHDIPHTADGEPVQSWSELGTAQSHGCIRQRPRDARALWRFAPVGTPVVVVA